MHKSTNKLLVPAIVFVVATLLAGCEPQGDVIVLESDDLTRVAASIARREDRVSAGQLARWIAADQRSFVVVDIRPASEYELAHVEHALSMPLQMLVSEKGQAQLPPDKTIVLYSNGNEDAGKAVVMLRLAGFDTRLLHGGFNHWGTYIINPTAEMPAIDEEDLTFTERRALACSNCDPGAASGAYTPAITPVVAPEGPEQEQSKKGKGKKSAGDEGC